MDVPGGPVVKNPPCNAGDVGSIPSQETEIPHAAGQLSSCAMTIELVSLKEKARGPQLQSPCPWSPCVTTREKPDHRNEETVCHNEKILHAATKIPCATTKTRCSQINR